jgi:hypothetical protein
MVHQDVIKELQGMELKCKSLEVHRHDICLESINDLSFQPNGIEEEAPMNLTNEHINWSYGKNEPNMKDVLTRDMELLGVTRS